MNQIEQLLSNLISRIESKSSGNFPLPRAAPFEELDLGAFGNVDEFVADGVLSPEDDAEGIPEGPDVPLQGKHNLLTHFPMDPKCPICQNAKCKGHLTNMRPKGPTDMKGNPYQNLGK